VAVAIACTTEQTLLGEGARWDDRRDELLRVDIVAGRVFRDRVGSDGTHEAVAEYAVESSVGAIAPIEGAEGWLLAAGRGFVHLLPDGTQHRLLDVAPLGTRMNDAACDRQGRFWAGTLADDHRPGAGSLYRLDRQGGVELVLDGLTIPNGIDWSPDGATMYMVDSGPGVIFAFTFDRSAGALHDMRVLVSVDPEVGAPDGMTVDSAGDLWVAVYGGGQVRRYSPAGDLQETLAVPAEQSTSCAFGGAGMHSLYVTTATENWSDDRRRAEPRAGVVYRFDTDATGRPAAPFWPEPRWWQRIHEPSATSTEE
jgi:sugar lactone lactonase YvrE